MSVRIPYLCRSCLLLASRQAPQQLPARAHISSRHIKTESGRFVPNTAQKEKSQASRKSEAPGLSAAGTQWDVSDDQPGLGARPAAASGKGRMSQNANKPIHTPPLVRKLAAVQSGSPGRVPPVGSLDTKLVAPRLPKQIQKHYARNSVVSLGRTSPRDPADPRSSIGVLPLPPIRDLVAAHELFGPMDMEERWSKLVFVRSTLRVPDICLLGRAMIGKTEIALRTAAANGLVKLGGKVLAKFASASIPGIGARPESFAWGFRTNGIEPRIRIIDIEGYGHELAPHSIPEIGTMLQKRKMIRGVALVGNSITGTFEKDPQMLRILVKREIPFIVILNKANALVPRRNGLGEDFPPQLWHKLLDSVDAFLQAIDEEGAAHLHRGTFVIGTSSFHDGPVGLLGVKYAMARLSGLIGDGTWGRSDTGEVPPLRPEETPLASSAELESECESEYDADARRGVAENEDEAELRLRMVANLENIDADTIDRIQHWKERRKMDKLPRAVREEKRGELLEKRNQLSGELDELSAKLGQTSPQFTENPHFRKTPQFTKQIINSPPTKKPPQDPRLRNLFSPEELKKLITEGDGR